MIEIITLWPVKQLRHKTIGNQPDPLSWCPRAAIKIFGCRRPLFFAKNVGFFQKSLPSRALQFLYIKTDLSVLIHETLLLGSFLHYFEVFVVFQLVQRGEEGRFVSLCISVCQLISQVSLDVNHIPSHVCFRKALNIAHLCSKVKIFFYWASRSKQVDTYFH